jgi:hypothetical protein
MAKRPPPITQEKDGTAQGQSTLNWVLLSALIVVVLIIGSDFLRDKNSSNAPSGGSTKQPSQARAPGIDPATESNFSPFNVMGTELFTSFMVTCPETLTGITRNNFGIPVYGNGKTFGVVLRNVKKGESYRVTAKANSIINDSTVLARITEDAPYVIVLTPILSDYTELAKTKQTIPVDFVFSVSRNGAQPIERSQRWIVHQINDCPISVTINTVTTEGKIVSNRSKWPYTIAGFVNENHPWIDSVLQDALKQGRCKAFIGYQGGSAGIDEQVEAIWNTLQKMGVKYSSITTSTASGQHRFQHIRFLNESIRNTQANCADGSVLFASILRKIGLNASVFLVPGHAYVAIRDKQDTKYLYAIETTMLADAPLRRAVESATLKQEFSLRRLLEDQTIECVEVNISEARRIGINPVPYLGSSTDAIDLSGRPPISLDRTGLDQTNYYNSIGTLTAAQFDSMMNQKLADKSQYQRQPASRIEVTRQLANKMEEAKLQLQINPLSAANRSAWKDVVNEINKHRNAFNNIKKPQLKSGTPQPELDKINPLYEESVLLLKVSDPSLGKDPSQFTEKEVQDSIAAAENALRALRTISVLPLDF